MTWQNVDLSELIEVIESGGRPHGGATQDSGEIPSLGGENIRMSGGLEIDEVKKVPVGGLDQPWMVTHWLRKSVTIQDG